MIRRLARDKTQNFYGWFLSKIHERRKKMRFKCVILIVLLAFLFPSIGAAIGLWIGGAEIVRNLF